MSFRDVLLIAVGGATGSVLRYLVGRFVSPQTAGATHWHWQTLIVNLTGAFLIGLLLAVAARHGWPGWWRPLVAVGLLGGFTTFSTFSLEVVEMGMAGEPALAAGYAGASLGFGVLGCLLGLTIGRLL